MIFDLGPSYTGNRALRQATLSADVQKMKILVVIANYGTKNDQYLQRLLEEYRSMSFDVHIVVLSDIPKGLGDRVEVIVETPQGDPWSFPFAHKRILAEQCDDYDLFIYSEDDTLITQRNIEAFLRVTEVLPENEIAGFIRSEQRPDGTINFSTVHAHFHWDPRSVVSRGQYTFAFFTNQHSGSYLLTRSQLTRAVQSGGFLVGPHQGRYHLPETAATDPYTQCGFKKMICISHIDDFVLPHLPNKYVGKLGLQAMEIFRQIEALLSIRGGRRPSTVLLSSETKLGGAMWSKSYYEPASPAVLALIPSGVRSVLSYGCGWGAMEAELIKRGIRVTAVALDSVIGACAEARGVDVIYGDSEGVPSKLSGERFDCILLSNVLHLVALPEKLLVSLTRLVATGGVVVATVPNLAQLPITWRRMARHAAFRNLTSYEQAGTHLTSDRVVRRWFVNAGLRVRKRISVIPHRAEWFHRASGSLLDSLLAEEFSVLGSKT